MAFICAIAAPPRAQASMPKPIQCTALQSLSIDKVRIQSAQLVPAGQFAAATSGALADDLPRRFETMPEFCRVIAVARPTADSHISIEVWLPSRNWNGRFLGTGNGGGAGRIAYEMGMVEGLKRGFAIANTDLGTAPDVNALESHPERWADFGHRATHEMTRVAKAVVAAAYRTTSFRSYFEGCSTGGQQALMTAQRYPDDYDGILAGDPGSNRTHSSSYFLWNYQALNAEPGSKLTAAGWTWLTQLVVAGCVGKDGGAPDDMFLTDPRRCAINVATLPHCAADDGSDYCLTDPQRAAVAKLYAGATNPRTGERIYPGLTVGAEDQALGPFRMGERSVVDRLYVLRWGLGSDFKPETFDFDRDMDRLDARVSASLNANDPDLNDFRRHGGKLILYTGLSDAGVPFDDVVAFYGRARAASSNGDDAEFMRLFLVPGMGHCVGGRGVTDMGQPFSASVPIDRESDILMSLVDWTESGAAPASVLAHKPAANGAPARERPICAYPALPDYQGGNSNLKSSFTCVSHDLSPTQRAAKRYLN
jgi:feruloyl esterase